MTEPPHTPCPGLPSMITWRRCTSALRAEIGTRADAEKSFVPNSAHPRKVMRTSYPDVLWVGSPIPPPIGRESVCATWRLYGACGTIVSDSIPIQARRHDTRGSCELAVLATDL